MNEDLSLFFNVDDFAVEVTIDGYGINGIFSAEYVETNFTQTKVPVFTYSKGDKSDVAINSVLMHDGITYKVKVIQHDGTGLINKLQLEKQDG